MAGAMCSKPFMINFTHPVLIQWCIIHKWHSRCGCPWESKSAFGSCSITRTLLISNRHFSQFQVVMKMDDPLPLECSSKDFERQRPQVVAELLTAYWDLAKTTFYNGNIYWLGQNVACYIKYAKWAVCQKRIDVVLTSDSKTTFLYNYYI